MTHPFDQRYFHGGAYVNEGYRDFATHLTTHRLVMERKPKSVLELGCARGYVLKRLKDDGVKVKGLEISEHCHLTRAVDDVVTWDLTQTPWPIKDHAFDLCLSTSVLEHIPEDKLPAVFAEMVRTCKRGLHGIDYVDEGHHDKTHVSIHDAAWWKERLPAGHEAVDNKVLDALPSHDELPTGSGVKLNIGCFTTMFYYGWRNVDRIDLRQWAQANGYSFLHWDIAAGLPYDDGVVDLIFASHVLEHFPYNVGAKLLAECQRVLKPNGVLRVLVPDARQLIQQYQAGALGRLDEMSATAAGHTTQAAKLWELLCAEHHALYDWETLSHGLRQAGFAHVLKKSFGESTSDVMRRETTDLYPDLSLIVEGVR